MTFRYTTGKICSCVWGKCQHDVPQDVSVGLDVDFKGQQNVLFCDRIKHVGKG